MNISQWWYIHSYIPLSMSSDVDAYDQRWMRPLYLGHTDFRSLINRCVQDLNTFLWGGWKKGCESILKRRKTESNKPGILYLKSTAYSNS